MNWNLNELILGDIWDLDLGRYEPIFKEVLTVAQGEMALEQYLNQVKESWQNYEVELINYQNKCKLIRGWDDLFTKLKDHLNSVSQMRLSPYYKVFEDEASSWDEKLNRMNVIFDLWIDVQRRWVYLEGILPDRQICRTCCPRRRNAFNHFERVPRSDEESCQAPLYSTSLQFQLCKEI